MALLQVDRLELPGLKPIRFHLDPGQCLAVMGPSGCGKTLLLRAIADLDPNQAEISLDGASRGSCTAPEWRRRVTYVPSESGWWSSTVQGHFRSWPPASLSRLGLNAAFGPRLVGELSTGERQRLALLRSLEHGPRVLLLDEITSGLDTDATHAVEELVADLRTRDVGVLWVTHDAEQARRVAPRKLSISNGEVIEEPLA